MIGVMIRDIYQYQTAFSPIADSNIGVVDVKQKGNP